MANRIFGVDGGYTIGTHGILANKWTIKVEQVVAEAVAYTDTWTTKKGGLMRATATVEGVIQRDTSAVAPTLGTISTTGLTASNFVLKAATAATACTYAPSTNNTAIVRVAGINHNFLGDVSMNMEVDFNGSITETWDTT